MAKSVTIEVDVGSGVVSVADGALYLGEIAPIEFEGYTPAEGNTLFMTLFAEDRKTPIADNHDDADSLDLRYKILRDQFRDKPSARQFYAIVAEKTSGGAFTGELLASGMIPVMWSPAVYDAVDGSFATLKGKDGADGADGADGKDGKDGKDGVDGKDGKDGAQGQQGIQGIQGETGETGEKGADAVVDATLSNEGEAADAKATGEAIDAEKERAKAAEDALDDAIDAEEERATEAEGAIETTIAGHIKSASYDSANRKLLFTKQNNSVIEIDASEFIKDGMVSGVEITGGNLVITFNTDSGKEPISIALTSIFNPSNYYDKTATDALLAEKQGVLAISGEGWTFEPADATNADVVEFLEEYGDSLTLSFTNLGDDTWQGVVSGYDGDEYGFANIIKLSVGEPTDATLGLLDANEDLLGYISAEKVTVAEAVPTSVLDAPTKTAKNLVTSRGVWGAIWGALSSLPSGVSSIYDWVSGRLSGFVPTTRKVNGKALSADVTLTPSDVGAATAEQGTKADNAQPALGFTPENVAHKVISISAESTDTQYPSAKAVFQAIAGATPNLDFVMRVNPQTGNIYYTTPDENANA